MSRFRSRPSKSKKVRKPKAPYSLVAQRTIEPGRVVEWPVRLMPLANLREHWAIRSDRAKRHRTMAKLLASTMLVRPALPCIVTITRLAPRELDSDGLVSSAKNLRDGLADWLGIDDRDPRVEWVVKQEKAGVRTYGVRVEVKEVVS